MEVVDVLIEKFGQTGHLFPAKFLNSTLFSAFLDSFKPWVMESEDRYIPRSHSDWKWRVWPIARAMRISDISELKKCNVYFADITSPR